MSKKVILGTLLASAALLSTTAVSHAATSDIKAESKKITITKDNAKLYKDSTMKESTVAKKGAVYQVDGYRDINGKHVYRLYQTDKYNKAQYKGYLVNTDAKDLKADKASGQYVAKKEATMWENFYWNNKREVTNQEKVFFAKYTYTLGNGDKYYSMYYKNADGKEQWAGYTNQVNVKALKATEMSQKFTLTKNYKTWNNLYFKQNKNSYDYTKGVNFQAKRYYTLNGNKFYSVYRTDSQGKEQWCGYANSYVLKPLTANKVAEDQQEVQVLKDYNTYKDHYFNKKGQLSKGTKAYARLTYTYGNGKQYASLYDGQGKDANWLGYANISAVSHDLTAEQIKSYQDALATAKTQIDNAQGATTPEAQEAANKAYTALENALKDTSIANKANLDKLQKDMETQANALADNILDQWVHKEENGKIILARYKGNLKDLTVPGQIGGKDVQIDTLISNFNGTFGVPNVVFGEAPSVETITFKEVNGKKVTISNHAAGMFYRTKAKSIDLTGLDLSDAVNVDCLFQGASNLTSIDLSNQDLSKVVSSCAMFAKCPKLTEIKFGDSMKDAKNNTDMSLMFTGDTSLTALDLTNVNTEKVTDMAEMFRDCKALTTLTVPETFGAKVTDVNMMIDKANSAVKTSLEKTALKDQLSKAGTPEASTSGSTGTTTTTPDK